VLTSRRRIFFVLTSADRETFGLILELTFQRMKRVVRGYPPYWINRRLRFSGKVETRVDHVGVVCLQRIHKSELGWASIFGVRRRWTAAGGVRARLKRLRKKSIDGVERASAASMRRLVRVKV